MSYSSSRSSRRSSASSSSRSWSSSSSQYSSSASSSDESMDSVEAQWNKRLVAVQRSSSSTPSSAQRNASPGRPLRHSDLRDRSHRHHHRSERKKHKSKSKHHSDRRRDRHRSASHLSSQRTGSASPVPELDFSRSIHTRQHRSGLDHNLRPLWGRDEEMYFDHLEQPVAKEEFRESVAGVVMSTSEKRGKRKKKKKVSVWSESISEDSSGVDGAVDLNATYASGISVNHGTSATSPLHYSFHSPPRADRSLSGSLLSPSLLRPTNSSLQHRSPRRPSQPSAERHGSQVISFQQHASSCPPVSASLQSPKARSGGIPVLVLSDSDEGSLHSDAFGSATKRRSRGGKDDYNLRTPSQTMSKTAKARTQKAKQSGSSYVSSRKSPLSQSALLSSSGRGSSHRRSYDHKPYSGSGRPVHLGEYTLSESIVRSLQSPARHKRRPRTKGLHTPENVSHVAEPQVTADIVPQKLGNVHWELKKPRWRP